MSVEINSKTLFNRLTTEFKNNSEYSQRIASHIRVKYGHYTIPAFHTNGVSEEVKIQVYGTGLAAILKHKKAMAQLEEARKRGDNDLMLQAQAAANSAWDKLEGQDLPKAQAKGEAPEKPEVEPPKPAPEPAPEEVEETPEQSPAPVPVPMANDAAGLIAQALKMVGGSVNPEQVKAIVAKELEAFRVDTNVSIKTRVDDYLQNKIPPRDVVEIVVRNGDEIKRSEIPRQHYKFSLLMKCLEARLNVLAVGPAGTGKTTAFVEAAKALGLPVELLAVGPQTSKADILGYRDANGTYRDTATVRRAMEGGLIIWDELDAGHAGVMTCGNALLANGHVDLAHGRFDKSKDFMLGACANTYGNGANRQYVGRNQLDAATLDRFVVIDWPTDEGLEASFVGATGVDSPVFDLNEDGSCTAQEWTEYVVKVREAVDRLSIRHVVSPRATIFGAKLFAVGVGRKHVEDMVLWKGMENATKEKVLANL